ncbi:hypothetical protein [Tenacibaculum sp. M341]|uniref:hypothetical protein n=1 Tax=Tenacibaculum sp. M341 TaxID=2530339 RepID=UPI00104EB4AC|nr:hypothetical protein [Tenacibaculum sp. M341]TCI94975.1 hypothetical protein EYW44_01240 [Tenacibaculum sp. M341]
MKENKCRIADAMNTYNTALGIIKSKGYKIFLYPDEREEYLGDFWAVKEERQFIGSDPLRLLGIISIWEHTGDDWQINSYEDKDWYDEILSRALPDDTEDFKKLTETDFNEMVTDYKIFFHKILNKPFPDNPSREEMFQLIDSIY